MSSLLRVKLFKNGTSPAPSKDPGPKVGLVEVVAVEAQQNPLVSLPVETLLQIISYLTNAERFSLKLSGNRKIRALLESRPKPPYEAYLTCLSDKPLSLPSGLQQVLNIASSIGYEALLLKLLREELFQPVRGFAEVNEGYVGSGASISTVCEMLTPALEHAAKFSQLAISKILLNNGAKNDNAKNLLGRRGVHGNALDWAAANGDIQLVALLLKSGADIKPHNTKQCAISYAAHYGHADVVKLLVKKVHWAKGRRLSRPLAEAARQRQTAIVQFLLDSGSNLGASGYCMDSPLHAAARGGSAEIFQMILKKGAKDRYVSSPMLPKEYIPKYWCIWHFAAFYGNVEILKVLLDEGHLIPELESEVLEYQDPHESVVIIAVAGGYVDVVKELLERRFSANALLLVRSYAKKSALHFAANKGHVPIMALLLNHGADVNSWYGGAKPQWKDRPLHQAAQNGSSDAINLLLDSGAHINAVNNVGLTALHTACSLGKTKAVVCLLERGAHTGILDKMGLSATSCSVEHDQYACLVLLLDHRKATGLSPVVDGLALHFAAEFGRSGLVPLLLQHGAKLEAQHPRLGRRPLHTAAFHGSSSVLEMLLTAGADPQSRCDDGQTAIHILISRGYAIKPRIQRAMIAMLIEAGLDINAVDGLGRTPLHTAGKSRNVQSFTVLVSLGAREDIKDNSGSIATDYLATFTNGIGSG